MIGGDESEPTRNIISDCMGLVPTIGENHIAAVESLTSAVEIDDPAIAVEKADEIRFRISQKVWLQGKKLADWANGVKSAIAKVQAPQATI
jgi:hypothetical protein